MSTNTPLMAPSAAASTSMLESAIEVPSGSSSPMTMQEFEMVSPWSSLIKCAGNEQTQLPPPDSQAVAEKADTSSSKSSDDSIAYSKQDTPLANVLGAESAAGGGGAASSCSSASATQRPPAAAENKSEAAPERDAFHGVRESSSTAGSTPLASAMSPSAIAVITSPPSVPQQVGIPIVIPPPFESQPDIIDQSSQCTAYFKSFLSNTLKILKLVIIKLIFHHILVHSNIYS